ncbi:cyclic nucleotide-binding domain-containing protein [bacterium]|nr:cyclic nucleotide-binding domain-containing protein [bacterium]
MGEAARTLKPGEYLFLQGEPGHELYFLKSGALEVVLSPSQSSLTPEEVNRCGQVIETFEQPGQLIGEISPILHCPRTASVRASKETTLIVADMKAGAMDNAIRANPALGIKIAEELARRISKTNDRLKKQDLKLLRFLEEIRNAMTAFWDSGAAALPSDSPEISSHPFVGLAKFCRTVASLPADLPISLALPYAQAGAFFAYFGGISFQTPKTETHAASAAEALARIQGKKYATGEVLCTSGEEAGELFILLQGRLNVVVGRRIIQTIQGRGSIVGEMAFLLKTRRTASVVAVESSTVLAVPYDKMEPLFKRVPPLLALMLRELSLRLLQVDTLLQKSTWRNLFFAEVLPAFSKSFREISGSLPDSVAEEVKDAAGKAAALVEEAAGTMSKAGSQDGGVLPFGLDELVGGSRLPPPVNAEELSEMPPSAGSHTEHADFVLCASDGRMVFGPPGTTRARFAQYLNLEEQTLVPARLVGKAGQAGAYAEVCLDDEGTEASRTELVKRLGAAIGVEYYLLHKDARRWIYQFEGGGTGAVSAETIPHASAYLEMLSKLDRSGMSPLDRARSRRLYLEAVAEILESHWSSPGQFTELSPDEMYLLQFGVTPGNSGDTLKLDAPPGRVVLSLMDFAKQAIVKLAGGEAALMGGPASAKAKLPEVEKKITESVEARKKAYEELQIPYEDSRETPLLTQIEKMTQLLRLKEKGGSRSGESLRDLAAAEKETEKMMDERNGFISQKLKGDAGRKALSQIKGIEDQIRDALREKMDLTDIVQMPAAEADAQKEKNAASLQPINLLNGFRDLLIDFFERIRTTLRPENYDVIPVYSEGVRMYTGRDIGIALQKISDKDKLFMAGREMPPILRVPGAGYAVYDADWNVFIVPLFLMLDPFQMMANAVGEWRWSFIPEVDRKKFQKALKGGASIKMEQMGIYFGREYRMHLDGKEIEENTAKFLNETLAAAAPAKS